MGDRICIRLTDGVETTPTFYGHWCGVRGLKVMIETLREPANSLGGKMCNFIVNVMGGKSRDHYYDIWNDRCGDSAANGDWWMWTYHCHLGVWTTTHPKYSDRQMTSDEVESIIRSVCPCLYRECKCEEYGSRTCQAAMLENLQYWKKNKKTV